MYCNDGFSTDWLGDFSLSMTNSHFFKPPNHTLKNLYNMAFGLLQKWFVLVPINDHAFKIKMIKPAKTHKLLQNGKLDPILRNHFPQNGGVIGAPTPPILWRKWRGGL
jgi:hypothetical protein